MKSLEEMKKIYREARAKEDAYYQSPALAQSPEGKRHLRKVGIIVFLVCAIPLTIANSVGYATTGRFITVVLAANIVVLLAALWMMAFGTNPFTKFKK